MRKHPKQLASKLSALPSRSLALGFVLLFAAVGAWLLLLARASVPILSFETESATLSGNATIVADPSSSAGQAIKFNAPTTPPTAGWPNANNTGVIGSGLTYSGLTPSGTITVTQAGTIIDKLDITGCIFVRANNVTIKRTRIRGSCGSGTIDTEFSYTGIVIEDVEIDGQNASESDIGVGYSGYTCRRCNIHHIGNGARMATDVVIEDSYIHDIYSANGSHNSAIGSNGGWNFIARHNNLDCGLTDGCSGALVMYGDFDPISNALIENNLLNGGGFCTYAGSVPGKPYPVGTSIRYINNHFGRTYFSNCGFYGPYAAFDRNGAGNVWSGNVWADTGQPVN